MKHRAAISKFWQLQAQRRSVALDINTTTGELVALHSVSKDRSEGLGAPGMPYGPEWARIMSCTNGVITDSGVFVGVPGL